MSEVGAVRRQRNRVEVEKLVAEYEASVLTRDGFCQQRGLSVAALDRYRRRVQNGARLGVGPMLPVEAVSYSWPLFLIAVPILAGQVWSEISTKVKLGIATVGAVMSWLFYLLEAVHPSQIGLFVLVSGAIAADWYVWSKYFKPHLLPERDSKNLDLVSS